MSKKVNFICLIILFAPMFVSGQSDKLITEYNADSTIRGEGLIDENNLKQGNWTYYADDGKVLQMGRFVDDLRTGVWLVYDNNGNIVMETNFVEGKSYGTLRKFYPGKRLKSEGEIKDDIRVGIWKEYHENGKFKT